MLVDVSADENVLVSPGGTIFEKTCSDFSTRTMILK